MEVSTSDGRCLEGEFADILLRAAMIVHRNSPVVRYRGLRDQMLSDTRNQNSMFAVETVGAY